MKKYLALAMAFVLVAAVFAGCGNSSAGTATTAPAAPAGTGTVKIGMSGPDVYKRQTLPPEGPEPKHSVSLGMQG